MLDDKWRQLVAKAVGELGAREDGIGGFVIEREGCPVVAARWLIAFSEPWVELVAIITPERSLRHARAALLHNFRLAVGALAVDGDSLVLRYTAPLAHLPLERLGLYAVFLAEEARRLSRAHEPAHETPTAAMFAD
jgi:hypothetical protein